MQPSIAFECTCEAVTHMMAIQSAEIASESSKTTPDADHSRLFQERSALHVHDLANIARIRGEYGAIVRAKREEQRAIAA